MTSDSNNKRPVPMATAGRQSRFSNYTEPMKPSQPIGSTFQGMDSIWSNGGIGAFGKRETTGSRGSDEKTFLDGPQGSGALSADSEADTWVSPRGPWNSTDNAAPRKTSGSTSPNRTRDMHTFSELNTPNYFTTGRQPGGQVSGFTTSMSKPATAGLDPSTNAFKYNSSAVNDRGSEEPSSAAFAALSMFGADPSLRSVRMDMRNAQDSGFPSVGRPPRDSAVGNTPGGHPDMDPIQQSFGDPFNGHPSSVGHASRPSVHASASFPTQLGASSRGASAMGHNGIDDGEFHDKFKRSFTIGDTPSEAMNTGGPVRSAFQVQAQQPFQFNPGSAPWDSSVQRPFGTPSHMHDPITESIMASYASAKRGSFADRGSPAGNPYRSNMTSPSHLNETPSSVAEAWSRQTSRDTRNGHDFERRGSATPSMFAQQQQQGYHHQQHQQQGPPAFFPPQGAFYPQNMPPHSYHPQMYDQYAAYRNPQMVSTMPYGMSFNQFLPTGLGPFGPSKDQDPMKGARSKLLEEFRASSKGSKRWELKDIYNHVVEFSGDQHGSRFIQGKLETANSDEKDQIFREIEPNAVQLMKDVFGNYVIQKFFEHGNQVQKKMLARQMRGKILDLSTQMYACRVVQKALEHVLVEQQAELVKELEPDVLRIVKDQNGNHVVQKVIELVPRQYIGFLPAAFRGQVNQLASHAYGCRVIQRMLEYGTDEDRALIMAELLTSAPTLIMCQYGNYVIQHVIEHGRPEDKAKAIEHVLQQLVNFSKHKFASNVVEKCIVFGTPEHRSRIREILTRSGPDSSSQLQLLIKDQYANYVIQKLLNQLEGAEKDAFVEDMKPQFNTIKKVSQGRQIQAIDKLISASESPASTPGLSKNGSTLPPSPGLQVDVSSAAPTPVLTMEPNTPQSSSPPSTNASAADDLADDSTSAGTVVGKPDTAVSNGSVEVRVADP